MIGIGCVLNDALDRIEEIEFHEGQDYSGIKEELRVVVSVMAALKTLLQVIPGKTTAHDIALRQELRIIDTSMMERVMGEVVECWREGQWEGWQKRGQE